MIFNLSAKPILSCTQCSYDKLQIQSTPQINIEMMVFLSSFIANGTSSNKYNHLSEPYYVKLELCFRNCGSTPFPRDIKFE